MRPASRALPLAASASARYSRAAAALFAAELRQLVEIVELGRRRGARECLVQLGVAQIGHAEHELRVRAGVRGFLQHARGLLEAALLIELQRHVDRVVAAPGRVREPEARQESDDRSTQHQFLGLAM
jgi:hypothetical protein